ncbi:DUF7453 family protein [Adhaeretor mobilis]|uniref:Uncharacterized protein n=1 Tax=Adhaeretor mobilis TaxID=1930276 RepID=A0A517MQ42_9BACT|nr:choice-of-anchor tandem repeat NxxGxxAF-containing protein [Adhaeretor mobilis]QDS97003.1 hypothetical protein HG15A2_02620 [Adhaeretor mobilis]
MSKFFLPSTHLLLSARASVRIRDITFFAATVVGFVASLANANTPILVARFGEATPDGNGMYADFLPPVLSDDGAAAFLASLTGTTGNSNDDSGLFVGSGKTPVVQIAREGQPAPDANGELAGFLSPAINNTGQVAVRASLRRTSGGSSDDFAILRGDGSGPLALIAREGQPTLSGDGIFSRLFDPIINDLGEVAFFTQLGDTRGGFNDYAAVYRSNGSSGLIKIARTQDPAPGGQGNFAALGTPAFNNSNEAAFVGLLAGLSGSSNTENGIFRGDGDSPLEQIVRGGQQAPGNNGAFSSFSDIGLNESGQVAFLATLRDTVAGSSDNRGVFLGDGSAVPREIARSGKVIGDGNETLTGFVGLTTNNRSEVAFRAGLANTLLGNVSAIFLGNGSEPLTEIVRAGQLAPDGDGTFSTFSDPVLNDQGQVAFTASLANTAPNSGGSGIFLFDDELGLIQVAREREPFIEGEIISFQFSQTEASSGLKRSGLNQISQLALLVSNTGGPGGIAVISEIIVPEPTTISICIAAGLGLLTTRHRRYPKNRA